MNVHFHLRVFAKPPSQSPVHFFPKANLLVFQRENKGMRLTLHISSKKTLNNFSFKMCLIFGNNHLWRHTVCFLLFVFVVPAVSQCWHKMGENIHQQLFNGEIIFSAKSKSDKWLNLQKNAFEKITESNKKLFISQQTSFIKALQTKYFTSSVK